MNTRQMFFGLAGSVLVAISGGMTVAACGDDSNPSPTTEAGLDSTGGSSSGASSSGASSSGASSSGASSSGASSSGASSSGASSSGASSSGGSEGGASSSSGGSCTPDGGDAAPCNSCATFGTDPYNTCSPYTTNCIPFDNSVVPAAPQL